MTGRQAQARIRPAARCTSGATLLAAAFLVVASTGAQAQYYDYGRSSSSVTVDQSVLDSLGPERTPPQLSSPSNPWLNPAPPPQMQAPAPAGKSAVNLKRPSSKAPRKAVAAKKKNAPPVDTASVPTITATQPAAEPVPATPPAGAKTEATPPTPVETPAKPAPKAVAATKIGKDAVKANPPPPEVKAAASGAPEPAPVPPLPSSSASMPTPSSPSPAPAMPAPSAPAPSAAAPPALPAAPAPSKQASATPPAQPAPSAGAPTPVTPPATAPSAAAPLTAPPPGPAIPAASTTQTATARTPSVPLGDGTRVAFTGEDTELNDAGKQALAGVVQKLQAQPTIRVQLLAYASGTPDQASKARRTSLSRALAVRTYLLAQGVQSTRIDVRALGNTTDEQPVDRVDAIYAKP
ncbi:MAG: OmpA family protein [Alphaproteobacteria bacterium]|nr:OmpA family protein [Alphaproteobacteria bacterium]